MSSTTPSEYNVHGTLWFCYSNSDSRIIEDDFLDIRSETRTFSLSFSLCLDRQKVNLL